MNTVTGTAPRKRALIIRPSYDLHAGFDNAARCAAQLLGAQGFAIERCDGPDATRDGILAAWDRLVSASASDDAAVVYYVGHGGITTNKSYTLGDRLPRYVQNICPTDFPDTTDDKFCGISTYELSLKTVALTRATTNVTIIFECCYSAQMVRGGEPGLLTPIQPKLTRVGLTKHLELLRAQSEGFKDLELTGNPDAVRVAAAGQTSEAYQITLPTDAELRVLGLDLPGGDIITAMTFRLAELLVQVGKAQVSWRAIAAELRARLGQRPEIEGPVTRVPFSLATVEAGAYPVRLEAGRVTLEAGTLFGVSTGDVYGVVAAGTTRLDPSTRVPELTIDEVTATQSWTRRITWPDDNRTLPSSAVALPKSLRFERYAVRVVAEEAAARATVEAALQSSLRIRPATPRDLYVLGELRVRGGVIELHDALGPLFPPAAYPTRLADAVKELENLATARRLHAMSDDEGLAPSDVDAQILVLGAGPPRALAANGDALGERDQIAFRLENRGTAVRYASVFNIGLRRRIALLTPYAASGIKLLPGQTVYVGATIDDALQGFELSWPEGLPRDQPRLDTTMVIVTDAPVDLGALESKDALGAARAVGTPLQALLEQLATGRTRGAAAAPEAFAIRWRTYRLFPISASLDLGAAQVNANPPCSVPPRAAHEPVLRIVLDASEVASGVRLDVLVCARGSADRPYQPTTLFERPGSFEIWRGGLRGVLDVYVWSSAATAERRTLAELIALQGTAIAETELRTPGTALAEGVSLQLAAITRGKLAQLAPDAVLAFRGSFGADDLAPHHAIPACGSLRLAFVRG